MRASDLLYLLLLLAPAPLQYWHANRLLHRGIPPTRVAGVAAAYNFTPFLALSYALLTDLPERLERVTGNPGLVAPVYLVPMLLQLPFLYTGYHIDRRTREVAWTFTEFVRATGRPQVLPAAFVVPIMVLTALAQPVAHLYPGLEGYLEQHAWTVVPGVALALAPSGLVVWLAWRWTKRQYEPVEQALAQRLLSVGERLGCRPSRILALPTGGGHVANAFVMGVRRGQAQVLLTDYLLEHLAPEEVELIFAHEVAHAHLDHLGFRLRLTLAMIVVTLTGFLCWLVLGIKVLHLSQVSLVLPVLAVWPVFLFAFRPLLQRQEFAADRWAAEATGRPEVLAAALEHLDALNHINMEQLPGWLRALLGHPLTRRRIEALRAMAPRLN